MNSKVNGDNPLNSPTTSILPNLDEDGYLIDLDLWNQDTARLLAANKGITLTDEHWEIIRAIRYFYQKYQLSPSQRPFVKYIEKTLGKDKGNSFYLMKLFPESPAKLAAYIAGLPRPTNCF